MLLVDEQARTRQGLWTRLELEPDLTVVGEAEHGLAALDQARSHRPDVVLMDVEMPVLDGIAATRLLGAVALESAVAVLTPHDRRAERERAREAGAATFVAKSQLDGPLLGAIREVAHGSLARHSAR